MKSRSPIRAIVDRLAGTRGRLPSGTPGPVAPADRAPADEELLAALDPAVRERPHPRVVVLVAEQKHQPGEQVATAVLLRDAVPGARVQQFDAGLDPAEIHVRLAAPGRADAVVVDQGVPPSSHLELFERTFGNLRRGGVFVVRGAPDESPGSLAAGAGSDTDLGKVVETLAVGRHAVTLTSLGRCAAILRESQAGELLDRAPARGRVLEEVAAAGLVPAGAIRHSPGPDVPARVKRYRAPTLALREYHDVTCLRGQVVLQRNVLLPDTFRHNQKRRLHNKFLGRLGPYYARPRAAPAAEHLDGAWFHLDSEFRGHFGHAMTEQLSRLWGWEAAKRHEPALKALMLHNKRTTLGEHEVLLYQAAGVDPDDLVLVPGPVTVDRLLAATPMFSQPAYVHPGLVDLWERVGSGLAAQAPEREYAAKVFCSRRISKRSCHNTAEVESFFADRGFEVIYPEDYPLTEQARIFREARAIGGFAGSALFNTLFCDTPRHVLMVSSESYTAKNEQMIAAARGHHLDIAWCRPDVPRPASGWTRKSFHSPFTFDPDREGVWLDQVLRSAPEGGRPPRAP